MVLNVFGWTCGCAVDYKKRIPNLLFRRIFFKCTCYNLKTTVPSILCFNFTLLFIIEFYYTAVLFIFLIFFLVKLTCFVFVYYQSVCTSIHCYIPWLKNGLESTFLERSIPLCEPYRAMSTSLPYLSCILLRNRIVCFSADNPKEATVRSNQQSHSLSFFLKIIADICMTEIRLCMRLCEEPENLANRDIMKPSRRRYHLQISAVCRLSRKGRRKSVTKKTWSCSWQLWKLYYTLERINTEVPAEGWPTS